MAIDVKTLSVGTSEEALTGKAIVLYDKTTGDPVGFDAPSMFKGAKKYYGVEWYTGTVTNPPFTFGQNAMIRIGNTEMHRLLPVQSLMRGCLLNDDGTVREYLSPSNWAAHDLSGANGQVMVEIPEHYRRFDDVAYQGTIRRHAVMISLEPFEGATLVPKCYIGAYEGYVSDNKLCSVSGVRPTTSMSRTTFRTRARARNNDTKWNLLGYEVYKNLFWLYFIEYANFDSQAAVNTARDANGYRQGGLGIGISNVSNWQAYNSYSPITNTGVSNGLGNDSGEVTEAASNYVNAGVTLTTGDNLVHTNRYRGIENPFGHTFKWVDGIIVYSGDSDRKVYATADPTKFSDSDYGSMELRGAQAASGSPQQLIMGAKGDIMCQVTGTNQWKDYNYAGDLNEGIKGVLFGGDASYGSSDGFAYGLSANAPSSTSANFGSRLCYIP